MKIIVAVGFALIGAVGGLDAAVPVAADSAVQALSHGGGCRKSSPPGQCCHMETATGKVHCH
ncbi:MAG: hypothetical protein ACK5IB_05975 [Qingshengfaniella sp.]